MGRIFRGVHIRLGQRGKLSAQHERSDNFLEPISALPNSVTLIVTIGGVHVMTLTGMVFTLMIAWVITLLTQYLNPTGNVLASICFGKLTHGSSVLMSGGLPRQ